MVKKWYSTKEVAEMLGYGQSKVRMLVIHGELRSLKDRCHVGSCPSGWMSTSRNGPMRHPSLLHDQATQR
jgi:excisionase family DNA binding protein